MARESRRHPPPEPPRTVCLTCAGVSQGCRLNVAPLFPERGKNIRYSRNEYNDHVRSNELVRCRPIKRVQTTCYCDLAAAWQDILVTVLLDPYHRDPTVQNISRRRRGCRREIEQRDSLEQTSSRVSVHALHTSPPTFTHTHTQLPCFSMSMFCHFQLDSHYLLSAAKWFYKC